MLYTPCELTVGDGEGEIESEISLPSINKTVVGHLFFFFLSNFVFTNKGYLKSKIRKHGEARNQEANICMSTLESGESRAPKNSPKNLSFLKKFQFTNKNLIYRNRISCQWVKFLWKTSIFFKKTSKISLFVLYFF